MKKVIIGLALAGSINAMAVTPAEVRFNNEKADTTRLTEILVSLSKLNPSNKEELVAEAGSRFLGTPYVAGTLEGDREQLTINTDGMDCTTFVETALALAMTIDANRTSWRDYINSLEQIRYRGGHINGYPSRLHYVSDWIIDNSHRGVMKDVTDRVGNARSQVKTLEYMSHHRSSYPALADSANYEGIKNVEMGYRSHKYYYINSTSLPTTNLREGDVVALTTNVKGLDVSHMGIIKMVNGVPHLMHASSKKGVVTVDDLSLADYMKRNHTPGIRVFRLAE